MMDVKLMQILNLVQTGHQIAYRPTSNLVRITSHNGSPNYPRMFREYLRLLHYCPNLVLAVHAEWS